MHLYFNYYVNSTLKRLIKHLVFYLGFIEFYIETVYKIFIENTTGKAFQYILQQLPSF